MREEIRFIADDGTVHEDEWDARLADARCALEKLVEQHVSYQDGKETVMTFLVDHGREVRALLGKMYGLGDD